MATNPKRQVGLARDRARELLDFNNAASSKTSDRLLSILEAGEGSSIARDQLDHYLHNYIETNIVLATRTSLGYNRQKLREFLSIKDKLAYVTANIYAASIANVNSTDNINDTRIRTQLETIICNLESGFINNRDFTESWILRNAAMNRFECKLSIPETNSLNKFTLSIKEVCLNNNLETLAESTHFTNESDAQKIMKISDIVLQLSTAGIKLSEENLKDFNILEAKIRPLKDLDKHYKHVIKTVNMLHRVAQKGYSSMIKPAQEKKVQQVLTKLDMTKTVHDALIAYNNKDNFDKNEEHTFLDNLLTQIQQHPDYKTTLYANVVSEAQFNERFTVGSAFHLTEAAKRGLDGQKAIAFGARLKDFEADTQSRRGLIRRRIFDIAGRMVNNPPDFAPGADFDTVNSYFDKFKDIFFAKEEDNYAQGTNLQHYDRMREVVSAIIRHRVPALASSDRIRRGSAGRIAYKFIQNALSGKERGMKDRIRGVRHHADDATVVAMVVMLQNEATNQVFYQDQNKAVKRESRFGKIMRRISFAEKGREAIRDRVAPTVNKALTFTEEVVKKGLQLSKGVAKVGNKIASKTARVTTRTIGAGAGKFNAMIKKGGYKRWKTLLYLPYMLTAPTEALMKQGYKGATYTDRMGNKHIEDVGKAVEQGYDEAKQLVSKATGEETNYLFQGLTYTTEQVTSLAGKTVSAAGKRAHDSYTTGQQRSILGAFYSAAKEQKGLEDLMQSSELADILNLKERGPYLFDEDGRIVLTEKIENRYPENEEGEKNIKKDVLRKKHDEIQVQFNTFMETLDKKLDAAEEKVGSTAGTDQHKGAVEERDALVATLETWTEEKGSMNELLLTIQGFAIGAITDTSTFHNNIKTIVENMKTQVTKGEDAMNHEDDDPAKEGYIQKIKKIDKLIDDEKLKVKKADTKMTTTVHEGDKSYDEWSGEKIQLNQDLVNLDGEITTNEDKLAPKEKKKIELEKAGDGNLTKDVDMSWKTFQEYKDRGDLWKNRADELKSIGIKIADPATSPGDKPNLIARQKKLQNEEIPKTVRGLGGNSDGGSIENFINKQKERFDEASKKFNENAGNIGGLESEIKAIKRIIQGKIAEQEQKKLRITEINNKLANKVDSDKGYSDYDYDKKNAELEIARLEAEKGKLTKKMTKQDEKNRVYRKLHKRGNKVQNLAKTLEDIHGNAAIEPKEKSKLIIKTVKDADLNFETRKDVGQKLDRTTLSASQKEELAALLKNEGPTTTTTPTT